MANKVSTRSRGYVTFLGGNDDYVKGVVGLAKGLRKVKSAYPLTLIVATLPDVPEEHLQILRSQGCIIPEIEPIYPPNQTHFPMPMPYYVINYSKLRIWSVSNEHLLFSFSFSSYLLTHSLILDHIYYFWLFKSRS